jgi:branched-chain amino acid aminotransferase
MKVWLDGAIVDGADARIPVTDHGLLYGDGVFEGIRAYGRRVFRLDTHLERLSVSAAAIGLEIPGGPAHVRAVVLDTLRALGADEAYVRLVITRGSGPLGVDPTTCPEPRLICIADQIQLYAAERARRGLDVVTVSVRRPAPDVLDPRVKSLNYLNSVMAKLEARRRGADEALILNAAGAIAEAAVANVFVARGGVLRTPPATDGALDGVTRDSVLRLAGSLGIEAREQTLTRVDLLGADEAFLTGTGVRIVPIRSLDGARLRGAVPGPLTEKLGAAFAEYARADGVPF